MAGFPPNWTFMVFSFIGFIMCLLPLRWHMQGQRSLPFARLKLTHSSVQCRDMRLHDVGWDRMLELVHQRYTMGW